MKPAIERWADRYGITKHQAIKLRHFIKLYGKQNEYCCNGDYFPGYPNTDKSKNSELWERKLDDTAERLVKLAKELGFTDVDFGVGIYPVLEKDGDTSIHIPD